MQIREKFFNKKNQFLTLAQIIEITGATLHSEADLNKKISGVATLENADEEKISFLTSGQYLEKFLVSKAGVCLLDAKNVEKAPKTMILLVHKNPYFAYAKIAENFYEEKLPDFVAGKNIHPTAKIGSNARIAPNAYIGSNVTIGNNCIIGPSATVMDNCEIGEGTVINAGAVVSFAIVGQNCIIHNGAKIGQDGFGFAHNAGVNHKIIQLGIVKIGNSVEIGANTCIDRGAIEDTIIMDGAKLDNLIQIGHNVVIGKGTVMAGCTAVAGSTKIGSFVQIGGSAGIGGHIKVGDGAKIAGMSGVMRDIEPMQIMGGAPALPIKRWHRLNAKLMKMAEE